MNENTLKKMQVSIPIKYQISPVQCHLNGDYRLVHFHQMEITMGDNLQKRGGKGLMESEKYFLTIGINSSTW